MHRLAVPEGRLKIAQQFIAGTRDAAIHFESPGGTIDAISSVGRHWHASVVPPGLRRRFVGRVPSDESLGYCQSSLRD